MIISDWRQRACNVCYCPLHGRPETQRLEVRPGAVSPCQTSSCWWRWSTMWWPTCSLQKCSRSTTVRKSLPEPSSKHEYKAQHHKSLTSFFWGGVKPQLPVSGRPCCHGNNRRKNRNWRIELRKLWSWVTCSVWLSCLEHSGYTGNTYRTYCSSGVEPASCYQVAGSIQFKCPWARYWTSNCPWCAGRHLAWQPLPSAYACMSYCKSL